jgi:hypothetical protein
LIYNKIDAAISPVVTHFSRDLGIAELAFSEAS